MAVDIRFIIDGQDRGQPLNPEEFGVTVNEDESITARVVSFDADLIFGGDVYSYLFQKLTDSGYCELVNVRVDYLCGKIWQKLVDGYIIVTESKFNYDKCQVSTKIYDQTFSTRINNNKSIPFSMNLTQTKNGQPVTPPIRPTVRIYNPATVPFSVYENAGTGVSVYNALKHLVACMSDNLVDFESNYFAAPIGTPDMDVLTNGRNIRTDVDTEIVISFEELFSALRSKFNIGMGFEVQPNGRPLLRIEPESYFFQSSPSANLYNQSGIEMNFDTARLYASVQFGNDPVLEQNESSSPNEPPQTLTFTQTPFRGFRTESFGFTGECNTSNVLNLETAKVIFDCNTIEDIYRFNNTSYDNNNIILQCAFTAGVFNRFEVLQTDPYGIGQGVYNGRYTNLNVSANWINGYPNSLFSFLQLPFNPAITTAVYSAFTEPNFGWSIINTEYTSYQEYNGDFYEHWNVPITANTRFDGKEYVVEEAGIYNVYLRYEVFISDNDYGGQGSFKALLRVFDGNDDQLYVIESPVVTPAFATVGVCIINTQIVCNVGDIIRTDVTGIVLDPDYLNQVNVDVWTTSESMILEIVGQPFNSENLEPVNIDDVQAYLYRFNRPLLMDEISSILSNTSNPITIGRRNDPLSVIPTYIKSMNIASILRKNAEFTLKSNRLLQ